MTMSILIYSLWRRRTVHCVYGQLQSLPYTIERRKKSQHGSFQLTLIVLQCDSLPTSVLGKCSDVVFLHRTGHLSPRIFCFMTFEFVDEALFVFFVRSTMLAGAARDNTHCLPFVKNNDLFFGIGNGSICPRENNKSSLV